MVLHLLPDEGKKNEEQRGFAAADLRQIIDTVPSFLWSADPNGEPTYVNQRALDYSGMGFEEFKRGGWEAFIHPDDFPETIRAFSDAIQTGSSYETVHRLRRADGVFRWHHARGEPLRDREGRIIQWYGLAVDIDEVKKAEDHLRRSEANLAEAQRLSHTGSWALNPSAAKIFYWSEECYRIWGFDPAHGLPKRETVWQRIHPDDQERVLKEAEHALREKRDYSGEFRIVLPDGVVKHLETVNHHLFSKDGELVQIVGTNIDVTLRTLVEQALRESERKHRQLIERIPCHFWSASPDGKPTYVNQRLLDYFGIRFEDQKPDMTVLHPDDVVESERALNQAFRTGESFQRVHRLRRADGEYRWHRVRAEPLRDDNGNIIQWYGFSIDIDEGKKAEDALRESEQSLRSAIDGIAGLVAVMAANGELETVNRQIIEYFGRSLEELKDWGSSTNDAVHPDDLPRIVELFKRSMTAGIPFNYELRLRRFDGEYRWFENRIVPIRGDSGRIIRWYALLVDIEERRRALAQLEQMQSDFAHMNRVSMMGELAASLSHEITQPIASARNNARAARNFLDKQPPDFGEVREALSCVVGDTDRAGNIIDRIRDHIKKAPPRKAQFDLNEAINEVIILGRGAVIKNGVSVQTRLSKELFPIHGDRVQLQQVVLNLLLNAVEAMGSVEAAPRELLISTEQDHKGVLVAVRDSGPGIHPEHLERVFKSFYTTKPRGTGMGLSICRSIVDAHGGLLWAEANEPRGTIFQFTLPAVP
jgi:PAS domain S-box-containing protein